MKTYKIVELPTKEYSKIGKIYEDGTYHFYTNNNTFLDNLALNIHIYATSNEPIRIGDWYYSGGKSKEYAIHQADNERLVQIANEAKAPKIEYTSDLSIDVEKLSDTFLKAWVETPVVEIHSTNGIEVFIPKSQFPFSIKQDE